MFKKEKSAASDPEVNPFSLPAQISRKNSHLEFDLSDKKVRISYLEEKISREQQNT